MDVDEEMKYEIDKLKIGNNLAVPSINSGENSQATPNSKFLFEKFSKLE